MMKFDLLIGQSLDSKIFISDNKRIFNDLSNKKIIKKRNQIRNKYGTILVGGNTIIKDNPNLINKNNSNIRIIIDKYGNLDLNSRIFKDNPQKTNIILLKENKDYIKKLKNIGVHIYLIKEENELLETINKIVKLQKNKKILIEGGAKTINMFLNEKLVENIYIFTFPVIIGTKGINFISEHTKILKLRTIRNEIIKKNVYILNIKLIINNHLKSVI